MSEAKYLSDGRKVVVLGKLNNTESIVQEVFVTDSGDEIPSGEKFTTKSLHDAPVVSWKAKEEAKLDARISAIKARIEKMEREEADATNRARAKKDIAASALTAVDSLTPQALQTLAEVLSGHVRYLVRIEYGIEPPMEFSDALMQTDAWGGPRWYEGIKLLSLYGRSNGDLSYRLHSYSDGSGGSCEVLPFSSYESALDFIRESAIRRFNEGKLGWSGFETCLEMGIHFPPNVIEHFESNIEDDISTSVARAKKALLEKEKEAKTKLESRRIALKKAAGE